MVTLEHADAAAPPCLASAISALPSATALSQHAACSPASQRAHYNRRRPAAQLRQPRSDASGLVRVRRFVLFALLLLLLLQVRCVDSVNPLSDEHLAVRPSILPLAVRLTVLPLALIEAAIGRVITAVAILHAVLPLAVVLPALDLGQHAMTLGPAHADLALVAVVFLTVEKPLHYPFAVGIPILAGSAPGNAFSGTREGVRYLAAAFVCYPAHVVFDRGRWKISAQA